jgi:phosphoenolpyruvate carboxykinase (GTP)
MLPFCGYNMGDYFKHWLQVGKQLNQKPLVYCVNWFRRDERGEFMWPGFGDNMRILKWIVDRVRGRAGAKETPLGWAPRYEDVEWDGCAVTAEQFARLTRVDVREWQGELELQDKWLHGLGRRVPLALVLEHDLLEARIAGAIA